jgi:hypothetical protein
MMTMAAS